MAKTIWKGAISFGLVTIPIRVYTATDEKSLKFNQLHEKDQGRIKYKRVCSADGEEVVGRLGRLREPGHPARLAQRRQAVEAAGEDLVRIALVADIPEQAVRPGGIGAKVVDVVQGQRQLDDPEVRREVPAVFRDGFEDQRAHFPGKLVYDVALARDGESCCKAAGARTDGYRRPPTVASSIEGGPFDLRQMQCGESH